MFFEITMMSDLIPAISNFFNVDNYPILAFKITFEYLPVITNIQAKSSISK